MRIRDLIFFSAWLAFPSIVYGACSVTNLTRCLDSVCAINIGANPAARCQYCGSSSSGEPTKSTAMKSISAGSSAKYTISDKELKKAPKDPGERYIWGTKLCIEKVAGCTPDDVTDNYDPLIEKSCTAAGIAADFADLAKKANVKKTQSTCSTEITACVIESKRCDADYKGCESEADFDKYFAECGVLSTGCENFLTAIRNEVTSSRKSAIANASGLLKSILESYQTAREQRLASARADCKNNKASFDCVERICAGNMRHKCAAGFEYEKTAAEQLCKFYDIACERLK